jgi:hypothetical protein
MLKTLKGIGAEFAGVLWLEGLFRPVSKPKPNTMPTSPITQDTAAAKASAGGRIRSVSEVCEAEGRDGMKRRITATHAACRTS